MSWTPRLWLGSAAPAVALGLPAAARAGTNVVPNPGEVITYEGRPDS